MSNKSNGVLFLAIIIGVIGVLLPRDFSYAIGSYIAGPIDVVLQAYILIMFVYMFLGEDKDFSATLKTIVPVIVLAVVFGAFFGASINIFGYIVLLMIIPLFGRILKNTVVKGGAFKAMDAESGKKWSTFTGQLYESGPKPNPMVMETLGGGSGYSRFVTKLSDKVIAAEIAVRTYEATNNAANKAAGKNAVFEVETINKMMGGRSEIKTQIADWNTRLT